MTHSMTLTWKIDFEKSGKYYLILCLVMEIISKKKLISVSVSEFGQNSNEARVNSESGWGYHSIREIHREIMVHSNVTDSAQTSTIPCYDG